MGTAATKIQFLRRVMGNGPEGRGLGPLLTDDLYVRDNIVIACEALKLKLVRLAPDRDGFGYVIRITPGGKLLAEGRVEEAATAIDSGSTVTRLWGEDPVGVIAARLYPGCSALPLASSVVRTYAAEVLRGIATGSFVVGHGTIRGVERPLEVIVPRLSPIPLPTPAATPKPTPSGSLRGHDRGPTRQIAMRRD